MMELWCDRCFRPVFVFEKLYGRAAMMVRLHQLRSCLISLKCRAVLTCSHICHMVIQSIIGVNGSVENLGRGGLCLRIV